MIMIKRGRLQGRYFYYLLYTATTFVILDVMLVISCFFNLNISTWALPDGLRIINIIPPVLAVGGLMGLIPDAYLSKKKKANIFYFINSSSFKDFVWFWIFLAGVQAVFFMLDIYSISSSFTIIKALDIATLIASLLCFIATTILLLRLLYGTK